MSTKPGAGHADFMREVAWWLLTVKKENRFIAEEIPIEIVPKTIRTGRNTSSAIREAIVGSVIEPIRHTGVLGSKAKKYYYFPHKSYLEFLVANYFQTRMFSVEMYREFLRNVNNEILTFLEEGPAAGIENLREGLIHSLGNTDVRLIEVCAKDKKIKDEILDNRKPNRHPSSIYTHYVYLRSHETNPESYLLSRLVDSNVMDSMLASLACIAVELGRTGNHNLARALLLNCITNISVHNIRRYLERGEQMEVYRADSEGLPASLLSECVSQGGQGARFIIEIEKLYAFLANASRAGFFVDLHKGQFDHKKIVVPAQIVEKGVGRELRPYIRPLTTRGSASGPVFPVKILGPASDRFVQ